MPEIKARWKVSARTQRFEGGSFKTENGLIEYSKFCSQPTDSFYQWCWWQVPLEMHKTTQCWPFVQGWHEAKPREYNT
jgi:hypothetical protein